MGIDILLILIFTAVASSLIGIYIVVQRMAMLTDALAHTVLLGIVVGYAIVGNLNSPWLLLMAAIIGFAATYLIEFLRRRHLAGGQDAIGFVYALFFAVAIILISLYFSSSPIDIDAVLFGRVEFAGFSQLHLFNHAIGPVSLYVMGCMLVLNALFMIVFNKELKLMAFDHNLAAVAGFMPGLLSGILVALTSLTSVAAFSAVGSIAVVALMVGPAATSIFLAKNIRETIIYTLLIAIGEAVIAYFVADYFNLTTAQLLSSIVLVIFLIVVLSAPNKGIISQIYQRQYKRNQYAILTLLVHFANHEKAGYIIQANSIGSICGHLHWTPSWATKNLNKAIKYRFVGIENNEYHLLPAGNVYIEKYLGTEEK